MTPTRTCPRCGRESHTAHSFCPACGESLNPPGKGHGWKLLIGVFLLFAGGLWAAALYTQTRQTPPRAQLLSGAEAPPSPATQTGELTSTQHLAAAKKALADGYRPHKDPKKAAWGEVATARWHLKEIGPAAVEYREAQELLKEVARRERQIELAGRARPSPSPTPNDNEEEAEDARPATASAAPARPSTGSSGETGRARTRAGSGSSSDDYYTNIEGVRERRPVFSEGGPPPGASAQCRDGSYSFSRNRRGTCSHHGGVARWL